MTVLLFASSPMLAADVKGKAQALTNKMTKTSIKDFRKCLMVDFFIQYRTSFRFADGRTGSTLFVWSKVWCVVVEPNVSVINRSLVDALITLHR